MIGHDGRVYSVAFDSQGSGAERLASAGNDGSLRIWSLSSNRSLAKKVCEVSHRNLLPSEWKKYFVDTELHLTCPNRSVNPDYLQTGREQTSEGKMEQAITAFTEVLAQFGTALFDPLQVAGRLAASKVRQSALKPARAGKLDQALADYRRAAEWNTELPNDPEIENGLFWYGSLWNRAADVLPHCKKAVAGNPDDGQCRGSRGVARALTGNLEGAAEDFRAFLEWGLNNEIPEEILAKRRQWIKALESGHKPFDAATLEALHKNEM